MSIKSRLQRLEQAVGVSIPSVAMIDPEAAQRAAQEYVARGQHWVESAFEALLREPAAARQQEIDLLLRYSGAMPAFLPELLQVCRNAADLPGVLDALADYFEAQVEAEMERTGIRLSDSPA